MSDDARRVVGKLEARWLEFLDNQTDTLEPEMIDALKATFYSGASEMYQLLLYGLDVLQSGEQAAADHMAEIARELNTYLDERDRRLTH